MLFRSYSDVDDKSMPYPITQVERRLDGTTYVYGTNWVSGDYVGMRIPDGIDLMTVEQLLENCTIIYTQFTRRNGKTHDRDTLDY